MRTNLNHEDSENQKMLDEYFDSMVESVKDVPSLKKSVNNYLSIKKEIQELLDDKNQD